MMNGFVFGACIFYSVPCSTRLFSVPYSENKIGFVDHITVSFLHTTFEIIRRNNRGYIAFFKNIIPSFDIIDQYSGQYFV